MKNRISDFITIKEPRSTKTLIQVRVSAELRKMVLAKMKKDGVASMTDLVVACLKNYLMETISK